MTWIFHKLRKRNTKIRALQGFFAVVSIYGLSIAPAKNIIVGLFAYAILETLGGNIGLHRYFCHRSFRVGPFWDKALCFLGSYIGVGSIISWVGQHRYHHKHTDTEVDVHSPQHTGIFKIIFGIWTVKIEHSMIRDALKNTQLAFMHKHYWKFHLGLISIYTFLDFQFGTWLLFSIYAMPNLMCLFSGYSLAIAAHMRGYRSYDTADQSRNCWITNIYTLGEGWHNNHHAHPDSYSQGEQWWEWDLPAAVIRIIASETNSQQLDSMLGPKKTTSAS